MGEMHHSAHRFEKTRDELSLEELPRAGEYPSTLAAHYSRLDQKCHRSAILRKANNVAAGLLTTLGEIFESEGLKLTIASFTMQVVSFPIRMLLL